MQTFQWMVSGLTVYILLFSGAVVGFTIWRIKRRKDRTPVEFKLLRGPGESLRRRLHKSDEHAVFHLILAALFPVTIGFLTAKFLVWLRPTMSLEIGLSIVGVATVVGMLASGRWLMNGLLRYRDDALGYRGERAVAEFLEPLLARGYRIFHDVPAEGAKKPFNLDHIAVGPSGVAVIETKTRRKGRARPGFEDHEVSYDGRQLIWPWGEDRHGVEQARNEAEWLRKWIEQRTGIRTSVKPILALPGWWVNASARDPVTVVNAKSVATAVEGRGEATLSSEQIDLIARQLDTLCRDVTD